MAGAADGSVKEKRWPEIDPAAFFRSFPAGAFCGFMIPDEADRLLQAAQLVFTVDGLLFFQGPPLWSRNLVLPLDDTVFAFECATRKCIMIQREVYDRDIAGHANVRELLQWDR